LFASAQGRSTRIELSPPPPTSRGDTPSEIAAIGDRSHPGPGILQRAEPTPCGPVTGPPCSGGAPRHECCNPKNCARARVVEQPVAERPDTAGAGGGGTAEQPRPWPDDRARPWLNQQAGSRFRPAVKPRSTGRRSTNPRKAWRGVRTADLADLIRPQRFVDAPQPRPLESAISCPGPPAVPASPGPTCATDARSNPRVAVLDPDSTRQLRPPWSSRNTAGGSEFQPSSTCRKEPFHSGCSHHRLLPEPGRAVLPRVNEARFVNLAYLLRGWERESRRGNGTALDNTAGGVFAARRSRRTHFTIQHPTCRSTGFAPVPRGRFLKPAATSVCPRRHVDRQPSPDDALHGGSAIEAKRPFNVMSTGTIPH